MFAALSIFHFYIKSGRTDDAASKMANGKVLPIVFDAEDILV
jgi:hypothetical protein